MLAVKNFELEWFLLILWTVYSSVVPVTCLQTFLVSMIERMLLCLGAHLDKTECEVDCSCEIQG